MLLRLACLGVTNVFALLRLLLMNDHGKDREILALRQSPASTYIEPTDSAASFTSTSMLRDQAG